MSAAGPGSPEYSLIPCHTHIEFSTTTNQKRRNFAFLTSLPNTPDPSGDPLLAAHELAAIAIGADPAFITVSSAETYVGRIIFEDISVRAEVVQGPEAEGAGDIVKGCNERVPRGGVVSVWNRDATGWQVVDAEAFVGEAGQRKGHVPQTAILVMMTGTCFRHGWKATIAISELCS